MSATRIQQEDYVDFTIAEGYEIKIPAKFIDTFTKSVITIPVCASDARHYEASQLLNWFANGKKNSPLLGAQIPIIHTAMFDQAFYNDIRNFFRELLIKDESILNDGQHDNALTIIKAYADGLNQSDQSVQEVLDFCKKHRFTIHGLTTNLPEKSSSFSPEHAVVHIPPVTAPTNVTIEISNTPTDEENTAAETPCCSAIEVGFDACVILGSIIGSAMEMTIYNDPGPYNAFTKFTAAIWPGAIGAVICMSGFFICKPEIAGCTIIGGAIIGGVGMATAAIAASLSYVPSLPLWATPLISLAIAPTAIIAIPKIYECARAGRFSFWNRNSATKTAAQEERQPLVPRPA